MINQGVWDRLSDEDKAGIERAQARNPFDARSKAFYAFENQLFDLHRSKGGTVAEPTGEEAAQWREGIEAYYAEVLKGFSPEGLKFWDQLHAARRNCAK